jgi:hypothetical protein
MNAKLLLEPVYNGEEIFDELQNIRGYLQIVNKSGYDGAEYRGVVLETQSLVTGAGRIYFSDPDFNSGAETVAGGKQIVRARGEGCAIAK